MNCILDSYFGFGDNIYHIPFVHHLAKKGEVYIYTPFPEMFPFDNVHCFKPQTRLKTQTENMKDNPLFFRKSHPTAQRIRFNYGSNFKSGKTIMKSFESVVPLEGDFFFDLKLKFSSKADEVIKRANAKKKKLCVIRLPSVRNEWACASRASLMEYFQVCIDYLRDKYYFVSVGDIGNDEDYIGIEPSLIDERRDRHYADHIKLWDMAYLGSKSDLVISMPCNMLPLCQVLRKRSFFIYGGYVPHSLCNDKRFYQVGYVEPDPFCFCLNNNHKCRKQIDQGVLLSKLEETIKRED